MPVTVWVGPSGSRAGSAGAYISAAADALGMAPGTNIGSATPISSGGEDLDAKVRNDFAASIAALAEQNGHDPAPYRAMVTESLNLTASEALAQDVADTVQPTIEDFVAWLDGRTLDGGEVATAGVPIEVDDLPWYLRVLQVVTDPNLVFLLLILGIAGIAFEVFNPGAIVPGVVGAISLLLALAGLAVMPFTWIGVILILLGIGLFVGETQVGGLGVFTVGGVVALALGGAFLFDSSDPGAHDLPLDRGGDRGARRRGLRRVGPPGAPRPTPAGDHGRGRDDRRDRHHPRGRDRARGPGVGERRDLEREDRRRGDAPPGDRDTRR